MKFLLVLLAAAAFSPAVHAGPMYSKPELCKILEPCEPPVQYASGPFLAPPVIRDVPLQEIQADCGGGYRAFLGDGARNVPGIMGCAQFADGLCIVHLPSDIKAAVPELYDVVRRHELAHCRGWVHGLVAG